MTDYCCGRRPVLTAAAGSLLITIGSGSAVGDSDIEWQFTDPDELVFSGPTVIEDTVYVGDSEGTVYALDADSGTISWTNTEPAEAVNCAPQVVDGTVYVGSYDGTVYAIDADSGTTTWSHTVASGLVQSSPTVADGTLYIGGYDALFAIDVETGEPTWTRTGYDDWVFASPTVVDGRVYIAGGQRTAEAIAADTGETLWSVTTEYESTSAASSTTVADGIVVIGSGAGEFSSDRTGYVHAFDANTGEEIWTVEDPDDWVRASPTVYDGTVFVGADDGTIYAIDLQTGDLEWTDETDGGILASPTVADRTVYFGNDSVRLYALDAATGERQWSLDRDHRIFESDPTVVDGTIYAAMGTDVYAVAAGTTDSSSGTRVQLGTLGHHGDWAASDGTGSDGLLVDDLDPEYIEVRQTQEAFTATATVTNPNDVDTTEVVRLEYEDTSLDETFVLDDVEVTVGANSSQTVRFEDIDVTAATLGEYEYGVFTDGDAATGTLLVTMLPGELEITELEPVEITVQEGETFDLAVTVANADHFRAWGQIELRVDDTILTSGDWSVAAESSDTALLEAIDVSELEPGSYEYEVSTDDDTAIGTLAVEADEGSSDDGTDSEEGTDDGDDSATDEDGDDTPTGTPDDTTNGESDDEDDGETSGDNGETENDAEDDTEPDESDEDRRSETPDSEPDEDTDAVSVSVEDEIPGFGLGTALTGVAGFGYVLKRRLGGEEDQDH